MACLAAPPAVFLIGPHFAFPSPACRPYEPPPKSSSLSPDAQPFQPRTRITVQWQPPPHGCVKLNFDGSMYYDGSGRASIGGVIRDSNGHVRVAFAKRKKRSSPGIAEAQALRHGLKLALKYYRGSGLVVEGDDRDLVRLLRGEDTYTKIPAALQEKILSLLGQFPAFHVQHIFREGNQVADALCREAYQLPSGTKGREWIGDVVLPGAVEEKVEDDAYGVAHVRICKPKPPK